MKKRSRAILVGLVATSLVVLSLLVALRRSSGFYWVTILPSLGGDGTAAHAINDRGQIVGTAHTADGQWHFFLWDRGGGMRDLGVTGGICHFDINDANQIVFDELESRRPRWLPEKSFPPRPRFRRYLWDPNCGLIHLDLYVAEGSRKDFSPVDINNKGCIVGFLKSGPKLTHCRAVLLEPIPERWGKKN
ncbi:MAG: hypothetical protein ABFD90_05250 [Phycisphaerales bacterium]